MKYEDDNRLGLIDQPNESLPEPIYQKQETAQFSQEFFMPNNQSAELDERAMPILKKTETFGEDSQIQVAS